LPRKYGRGPIQVRAAPQRLLAARLIASAAAIVAASTARGVLTFRDAL